MTKGRNNGKIKRNNNDLQRDVGKEIPETQRMGREGVSAVAMIKGQQAQKEV